MKSLADLEAIRKKTLEDINLRTNKNGTRIVVGMATCGIAAGARPVMSTLLETLKENNISDVNVSMTGCIGICRLEPIIEVISGDGDKTTYVKMDAEKAVRVIKEHVIGGKVCADLTIGANE